MRTIKFRWYDEDNKLWLEQNEGIFLLDQYGHRYYLEDDKNDVVDLGGVHYSERKITIEQFTGLTDKNGKEIYEGDIVASVNYDGTISKDIVFYHDGNQGYGCYLPFGNDIDSCMGSDVKVIGNIHDNPELLGGNK
jgi:uncharacterized phage protein (TIGR01671 family)